MPGAGGPPSADLLPGYDTAIDACIRGNELLDADDAESPLATVLAFIRELAEAEDDDHHSVAEALTAE